MLTPSSVESPNSDALRFLADIGRRSLAGGEGDGAFCTTPITLLSEHEAALHMAYPSEMGDDTSSLNASAASADSAAMPECVSTRCNTPDAASAAAAIEATSLPALSVALVPPLCGDNIPSIYKLSADDPAVRADIAKNAKLLLQTLTGHEADDIIDLLYVKETWFSTEVLIHTLCLVNRLTFRYPAWGLPQTDAYRDDGSVADSPTRCSSSTSAHTAPVSLPHVCSSTSSEVSHLDAYEDVSVTDPFSEFTGCRLARIHSSSTNSLGDIFNRHNTRRRIVALLLLSGKFHGDVVYKTSSLAKALNKDRDEQRAMQEHSCAVSAGGATSASAKTSLAQRLPTRIVPARLGQCEKQLFQELGCSVFVRREEYHSCEDMILHGL